METNVEIVDQDVERVKLKYGDKEIPKEELKKFKVSTCFNFDLLFFWKLHLISQPNLIEQATLFINLY